MEKILTIEHSKTWKVYSPILTPWTMELEVDDVVCVLLLEIKSCANSTGLECGSSLNYA